MKELIELLENDKRIISIKDNKSKLLSDDDFIFKVKRLNELDKYSDEYKKLKKELFENETFIEFKQLENEINLLIMEINQKLKELTDERNCG